MHKAGLRKTPLAQGIALALGVATLTPAFAQSGGEETTALEEVVVTGIRASLENAMDIKRTSTGVVDAITAEEMGKFPDQNLAEALSRITGVSIDRFNAEGSRITVRGMGPEFNLVTLNGRSMPTAGGRSFDFNDIASEGVSAVEVFKTAKANLPTGGIGATVNIKTARPLDNPGFRSVLSAKAVHETSSADASVGDLDEITPEIAGIFSGTFADDTFGILLSGSYQQRDNREENAAVDNWAPSYVLTGNNNNPLVRGTVQNNNQRDDGVYWHPQNVGYGWSDITRSRINGQAVLQWAPSDRVTATLDYTYSEFEFEKDANSVGIWFECENRDATINERGTVTQVSQSCGDYSTNISRDHTIKENDSLGFNVVFQATDNLTMALDAHTSSSQLRGGGIGGEPMSSANLIIGNTNCPWCVFNGEGWGPATAGINVQTATYPANGIPRFDMDFSRDFGATILDSYDRVDIGSLFGQAFNTDVKNDIDQFQLSGAWKNASEGAVSRIDFGYAHTKQKYVSGNAYSNLLPAGFWLTSAQYWPDDEWQEGNFRGLLSNFSNSGNYAISNYYTTTFENAVERFETVGTNDPISPVYWPGWGSTFQDPSGNRGRFWPGPLNTGSTIEETINSFYTQVVLQDEFNGMPINAVLGLRYEDTSLRSAGRETPATAVVWVNGNEFRYDLGEPTDRTVTSGNEFWLPSLDVDMEVTDDVVARFSYSRSISRPPVGALSPSRDFSAKPNNRDRKISSGNPDLLPYVSDNFDLSLEWYYAPGSYVSVGYYRKKVDNFLVTTFVEQTFEGLTDPYIGAAAEQARAELEAEGAEVSDQTVFARINENRGTPLSTPVYGEPGDPLVSFTVTTTDNAEVGNLYGWELAVQHMFGDTGFGVQANATIVEGDVDADRNVVEQSFALPGLSNSANLTLFYENDWLSTRLAYNWRDEFLGGFDQFGSPVFNEEYQQLDFNLTWYATDRLDVFFEAINITEEVQRTYVRYPEQLLRANQYGARYNIGARYNF